MSEMAPEAHIPTAITKTARDLTEIEHLTDALLTQAVHKANDPLMPGGNAMVSLGSVASPEAWENLFEAAETYGRDISYADDEDDTWEPPLQTLLFWSEQWRTEHGYPLDRRPTIGSETNFIRWCLNWAWDHEERFTDFAADIRQARLRLENVLHAGKRADRTRVICDRDYCQRPSALIKVHAPREHFADECATCGTLYGPNERTDCCDQPLRPIWQSDEADDHHKCPACKHRYDTDDFRRAYAKQLRSEGAARFVPWRDALATLKTQGRAERTVRQWVQDGDVDGWCDLSTRALWVWWPDLWRLHLTTKSRQRGDAA